jgi:hypothetical protein
LGVNWASETDPLPKTNHRPQTPARDQNSRSSRFPFVFELAPNRKAASSGRDCETLRPIIGSHDFHSSSADEPIALTLNSFEPIPLFQFLLAKNVSYAANQLMAKSQQFYDINRNAQLTKHCITFMRACPDHNPNYLTGNGRQQWCA